MKPITETQQKEAELRISALIKKSVDGYIAAAVPPEASSPQVIDTRLAFYAGMLTCFRSVSDVAYLAEAAGLNDDQGAALLVIFEKQIAARAKRLNEERSK